MDQPPFLSGQLLLAMPGMEDPRFERAVIALCSHDEQGAMGIGLGRIIPRIHFHDLLNQFDIPVGSAPDVPIYLGGPVETQRGFILHTTDWACDESLYVGDKWVLSATLEILRAIAEGRGPGQWVAALGYAGWGAEQLEQEMLGNSWFATPGSDFLLYECDVQSRWEMAFRNAGIDPRLLTVDFGTA